MLYIKDREKFNNYKSFNINGQIKLIPLADVGSSAIPDSSLLSLLKANQDHLIMLLEKELDQGC